MKMSPACEAPIQPRETVDERKHPLYPQYLRYKSAMSSQLVRAMNFQLWLYQTTGER